MGYCDSKVLESHWFNWLVSSSTPNLELYRKYGLLWTKIIGKVTTDKGKILPDPSHQHRCHCVNVGSGVYFQTFNGEVKKKHTPTSNGPKQCELPLDYSPEKQVKIIGFGSMDEQTLRDKGYIQEVPTDLSWHFILADIFKICNGISKKFKQTSEDARDELAADAMLQVTKKLAEGKLRYIPGKAPVFNLLTTTIHRCMFSFLNKKNRQTQNLNNVIEGVANGMICQNTRSLRCPIPQNQRRVSNHH